MRRTVVSLFVLATFATFTIADDFTLRNAAGETFGPFPIKEGAAIRLDDTNYRIASITNTAEHRLLRKLETIIIPEINFKAAPMEDVVSFLRAAAKKYDPTGEGVTIGFTSSPWGFATNMPPDGNSNIITSVTLSARQIPLLYALKVACETVDFRCAMRRDSVLVLPRDAPGGVLLRRFYDVLPSFLSRTECFRPAGASNNTPNTSPHDNSSDLRSTFSNFGVSWPRGSSVQHVPQIGKLIVVNTEENLVIFNKIMSVLNVTPVQIQMEFFFVAFPTGMVAKAESGKHFTGRDAMKLWNQGKGRSVVTLQLTTKSGSESTAKAVTEFIYPTEFEFFPGTDTNATTRVVTAGAIAPGGFETREVGAIVSVMPEVTPDGQMIDLIMTPQFIEDPVWENYQAVLVTPDGSLTNVTCRQPIFTMHSISSAISMYNGATVMVAGGWPLRRTPEVMYLIVTANMVTPNDRTLPSVNPTDSILDPL